MPPRSNEDDSKPVSQRVVEAVADATGTDPTEVAPMYPAVDPDRLNALFDGPVYDEAGTSGYVTFVMSGCRVVMWDDGTVEVAEGDADPIEESPVESCPSGVTRADD